jgi:multisubunit Na+/H+ antiporter MnhC subunit
VILASSLEERLDSIISIAATVSHETRILRTAMEQMEKDLEKTVIITGIVAGMATVAFVHLCIFVALIYGQIMMEDGAWDVAMTAMGYERCFILFLI